MVKEDEVAQSEFSGMVKKIDQEKGYGFISCAELFETYHADVFVTQHDVRGLSIGDQVCFSITINKRGKPQALRVRRSGGDPASACEDASRFSGIIKSFDQERGYGFISSLEVQREFQRDVFLHGRQARGFRPGERVSFVVRKNDQGQPQAYDLREAPETVQWLNTEEEAPVEEEYFGEIKSFNSVRGYGFIDCDELFDKYSRDVFMHQSQFEGLHVGDQVTFKVRINRGQPQAYDVVLADPDSALSKQASAASAAALPRRAPPSRSPEAQAEVDKRLLRACASARVESAAAMEAALAAGANAGTRDVTGQPALVVAALNVRHSEKKCRLLIEANADIHSEYKPSMSIFQWAKERINPRFAQFLEAVKSGSAADNYAVVLDIPHDAID